jgi:DNA-binding XRE family transcriptional regulator
MSCPENNLSARSMDELIAHATALAESDDQMRYALIRARKDAGLTQSDVAEALGIKQSSVAAFERHDNDPRLSTIRRYALAVGALVRHEVTCDAWGGGSWQPVQHGVKFEVAWHCAAGQVSYAPPSTSTRTDFAFAA